MKGTTLRLLPRSTCRERLINSAAFRRYSCHDSPEIEHSRLANSKDDQKQLKTQRYISLPHDPSAISEDNWTHGRFTPGPGTSSITMPEMSFNKPTKKDRRIQTDETVKPTKQNSKGRTIRTMAVTISPTPNPLTIISPSTSLPSACTFQYEIAAL